AKLPDNEIRIMGEHIVVEPRQVAWNRVADASAVHDLHFGFWPKAHQFAPHDRRVGCVWVEHPKTRSRRRTDRKNSERTTGLGPCGNARKSGAQGEILIGRKAGLCSGERNGHWRQNCFGGNHHRCNGNERNSARSRCTRASPPLEGSTRRRGHVCSFSHLHLGDQTVAYRATYPNLYAGWGRITISPLCYRRLRQSPASDRRPATHIS